MTDEWLGERIVRGLDELPVPPPPPMRFKDRKRIRGVMLLPGIAAAAIALLFVATRVGGLAGQTLFDGRPGAEYRDDFGSPTIDRGHWDYFAIGIGPAIDAVNGRVEVTIPATTHADPGHTISDGHIVTRCQAHGDYDVRIDYALLEWPANNGVYLQLGAAPPIQDAIFRTSPQDAYQAVVGGAIGRTLPSTDTTGTLRLTRVASTITAYVLESGTWVQLASGASTTADVAFQINVNAEEGRFQHKTIRVAFDNFSLRADKLICPGS